MADETEWDIGDEIILQGTFENRAGVATDPSAVTGSVREPTVPPTVTALVFQDAGQGIFEALFTPTVAGRHWWRIQGTGAVKSAGEQSFHVRERHVGP